MRKDQRGANAPKEQSEMLNGTSKSVADEQDTSNDPAVVLDDLKQQIKDLEARLALARGTQDNIEAPKKMDIGTKIEMALRSHIFTTEELAKAVGEPVAKVQEKLKSIRKNLADVGTPDLARWVWRIGDDTPASELRDLVARLIEGHAMTTAELTRITGARMSRVNGVIVDLQRTPDVQIYDLGSKFRAKWIILPKAARPANLPPKVVKK
jgi:hypothetical protein